MKLGDFDLDASITGDARVLSEGIPDESVDLILCDPIYWQIEDYLWLANLAYRVLVNGGNVVAQVGSEHRFEAETAMRLSKMTPRPLLAECYPAATSQMFKHKILIGWKPHIWMSKGIRAGEWMFDRVSGQGAAKGDHKWQDSPAMLISCVLRLSKEDGVILDPFCGSGTVVLQAKRHNRRFLAFEIDPATADIARARLASAQPLLRFEAEQMKLAI